MKIRILLITIILSLIFITLDSAQQFNFSEKDFLKGEKFVSPPGTFKTGSLTFSKEFSGLLVQFGRFLKKHSRLMIQVDGFTDNVGSSAENMKISLGRAKKIKDFLVKKMNIYSERIAVKGFASESPIGDNGTEKGRLKNRRVEIYIQKNPRYVGIIASILKDVFTKAPQEINFKRAQLSEPLFNLFRLNTGKKSDANITLRDNSSLSIGPNSLMVIYEQVSDEDFSVYIPGKREIRLMTGFLRTKLNSIRKGFSVKTPACKVNSGSKVILVDISRDKRSAVSVFDGKSEVVAARKKVDVPKGFGTYVKKGEKPAEPEPLPRAPQLKEPLNKTVYLSDNNGSERVDVEFSWKTKEPVSHIQVAKDNEFNRIVLNEKTGKNKINATFGPGKYFWRVAAVNGNGIEGFTGDSAFTVKILKKDIPLELLPVAKNSVKEAHDKAPVSTVDFIIARGKTLPGAKVTINGIPVVTDSRGGFSRKIFLHRGWNLKKVVVSHKGYRTKIRWISVCYYPGLKHSRFYKIKTIDNNGNH